MHLIPVEGVTLKLVKGADNIFTIEAEKSLTEKDTFSLKDGKLVFVTTDKVDTPDSILHLLAKNSRSNIGGYKCRRSSN
ncbi:hypothetical protein [Campylobacter pinnipediorum]|uniref:Uncharacterized protein n=2 Tax=Campylobacter TaxID=194 RepID=A0AAX0LBX2_9BACT|nr:hypothetical protein [Campylobacter pinnipediorum]OPA76576.1 hypothetical protein BFG05_05145 [Campylobacter pinnipediorum subsp. pinnipediorum]OPA82021.1 hypothetical protein BFG04_07890 [Campylobacter pinnipediorum subsp. pinnipediorum]